RRGGPFRDNQPRGQVSEQAAHHRAGHDGQHHPRSPYQRDVYVEVVCQPGTNTGNLGVRKRAGQSPYGHAQLLYWFGRAKGRRCSAPEGRLSALDGNLHVRCGPATLESAAAVARVVVRNERQDVVARGAEGGRRRRLALERLTFLAPL